MQKYPRPPIVEAALHVRFVEGLSRADVERLPRLLEAQYPKSKPEGDYQLEVEMKMGVAQAPKSIEIDRGARLMSASDQKIVVIRSKQIVFGYHAPYQGWDDFVHSAKFVFETVRTKLGFKAIKGAGLRYINRLDIPIPKDGTQTFQAHDYLAVGVALPPMAIISQMRAFHSVSEVDLNHDHLAARITAATAMPALINFVSLLLDIDIVAEREVPQKEADFWALVGRMRDAKNTIFENSITDQARSLFK